MLFSDTKADTIRDHLIRLVETAAFCMRLLETPGIPGYVRTSEAHKALYDAMTVVVDSEIATNFEFGFMLDQVSHKLRPFIAEDKLAT